MGIAIENFGEDLFELEKFAKRLESFIEVEKDYVDGGLVLGLSAPFGTGKSTFLRMWKNDIENDSENNIRPLVVELNAWESDYYGDPIFGIISALIHSKGGDKQPAKNNITEAAKDIGWFMVGVGGQIASAVSGVNPVGAAELVMKKKSDRNDEHEKFSGFTLYEDRKKAMSVLQDAIRKFVEDSGKTVLFLVDELDRCRPDYAISYLETIKHIFDIPGTAFLIAADRNQLENSARMAFGQDLNFNEYYRKFIHRETQLPELSDEAYRNMVSNYVRFYLDIAGKRHCFMNLNSENRDYITEIIAALKLTPRQTQEVFRVLGHTFDTTEKQKGKLLWALGVGTVLMSALRAGDYDIYLKFGLRALGPVEVHNYFVSLVGTVDAEWWFNIVYTGDAINIPKGENTSSIYRMLGFIDEEDDGFVEAHILPQYRNAWGRSGNRISTIYSKIEQIEKFG